MKARYTIALVTIAGIAAAAMAQDAGIVSTDRFGYDGSVVRYDTLADAQAGTNPVDTITVGDRDLSLYIASDDPSESDFTGIMGSWWYTMDTHFSPTQGRAGFGNTRGNTGVGYLQLYDSDSSTDTNVEMSFSNFDGTHYTQYDLTIEGANATGDDYSRFSAIDNVNDGGIWHTYALSLAASGLEGTEVAPGVIESTNQPTGVSGSITGLFEITENQTTPANQGFYVVDLQLSMTNWAYENRADLTPQISMDGGSSFFDGSFADSFFRVVPEPGAGALFTVGGLALLRRRRNG